MYLIKTAVASIYYLSLFHWFHWLSVELLLSDCILIKLDNNNNQTNLFLFP